jgi:low affinity Fe/Cu permease
MDTQKDISVSFGKFSNWVAKFTGSPAAFIGSAVIVLVWALTGPVFHYSDTWQLVINTGTTVITFLMVFVIQQSQNKETSAIQIKLNELIAANKNASNRVVGIENLSEAELKDLKEFYDKMAELVKTHKDLFTSQSVDKPDLMLSKKEQEINTEKNILSKPKE